MFSIKVLVLNSYVVTEMFLIKVCVMVINYTQRNINGEMVIHGFIHEDLTNITEV